LKTKFVEKIKIYFMFSISENRAVYEIMWKNMVRAGQATDDNIIRHMPDT